MEVLAQILADRVAVYLPFLDRATGLARLLVTPGLDGNTPITLKLPVPIDFNAQDCVANDRYLMPSDDTAGILFFEDGGSTRLITNQYPASVGMRQSLFRLLLWVNTPRLDGELSEEALLAAVERGLAIGQRFAEGNFLDVSVSYVTLPAEASLFSRYSFESATELLFPPYRLLGLALTVQYRLRRCAPVPALRPNYTELSAASPQAEGVTATFAGPQLLRTATSAQVRGDYRTLTVRDTSDNDSESSFDFRQGYAGQGYEFVRADGTPCAGLWPGGDTFLIV